MRKLGARDRLELMERARALAADSSPRVGPGGSELPVSLQRLCGDGPWFGRQAELNELLTQWQAAAEARVVMVRGEPGIGKSRLVAEFATAVHQCGGLVTFGACV